MHDILHAVNQEPGIGVTRLLFLSNLSHERLNEYLGDLRGRELVEERDNAGRKAYHITERGLKFLVEVQKVRAFMSDFGLEM